MNTLKLWLEPDMKIPEFSRLNWSLAEVSIRDILLNGVHPYDLPGAHPSAKDVIVAKLNALPNKLPDLEHAVYCIDLRTFTGFNPGKISSLEMNLRHIREDICFVESLTYLELVEDDEAAAAILLESYRRDYP